jgi:Flp pilus assembly pilin Flp
MILNSRNNNKGQNLIEYAIVVALISAALAVLSTYVFRSVQAQQKMVTGDAAN